MTTHNLQIAVRVDAARWICHCLQDVGEKNNESVVELVGSQYDEHQGNNYKGENGLPSQHDDKLGKGQAPCIELAANFFI